MSGRCDECGEVSNELYCIDCSARPAELRAAKAEEREACAKLCDVEMAGSKRLRVERDTAARLAIAIRALGDKPCSDWCVKEPCQGWPRCKEEK